MRHAEVESRCRLLARQVAAAGLGDKTQSEAEAAAEIDQALFGSGGSSCAKHRPPEGWPVELQYTHQLVWDEVPAEHHFLRDRIADPGSRSCSSRTSATRAAASAASMPRKTCTAAPRLQPALVSLANAP